MALRGHQPVVIEEFNGFWDKGDIQSVPQDHFADCENLKFVGQKAIGTRDGVDIHQDVGTPLQHILRAYNYITQTANTLLVLCADGADGKLYHVVDTDTVFGPLLTITGMTDFVMVSYAGRAYISPVASFTLGELTIQKGMQNEEVYVYDGDGTTPRVAGGGTPPAGTIVVANGAAGGTDAGLHLFGVVFETDTGALSAPGAFEDFTTNATLSVSFSSIPISGSSAVTKRHIVASKVITSYNGNTTGYEYFFIPGATLNDNVTTTLPNISFFDADLLENASHLFDNFSEIPAGAVMGLYHNRMIVGTTYDDISVAYVSAPGEPEAISQIDGILIVPLDGNPLTNCAELRDILYLFKRNRTIAYTDNDDVPSTWPFTVVDQALGCPIHGIATVIDQGSQSVDFLLVATFAGIMMFNGRYMSPELTWKIDNYWKSLDRDDFYKIQMLNDAIQKILYATLPNGLLLVGDYRNGMDPQALRWMKWRFDFHITTIALVNINTLIIGSSGRLES